MLLHSVTTTASVEGLLHAGGQASQEEVSSVHMRMVLWLRVTPATHIACYARYAHSMLCTHQLTHIHYARTHQLTTDILTPQ
jgi:hypothetical protein